MARVPARCRRSAAAQDAATPRRGTLPPYARRHAEPATILGLGLDVCEVERFAASLERTPGLRERLFTSREAVLPPVSLAARFAAKEALAKALGAPAGLVWLDAEVVSETSGQPRFELRATVRERADRLGVTGVHLSLTHDAGIAAAVVVLEG